MSNLLASFEAFMVWLSPPHMTNDVHLNKRARLFLFSHLFGPFLGLPVAALMYAIDPNPFPHVAVLALSISGFWLFVFLVKWFPKNFYLIAHASIANLNFAVLWGSYFFGGSSSPFLMWYVLLPILAFFYLGSSKTTKILVFLQIIIGLGCFVAIQLIHDAHMINHVSQRKMIIAGVASTLLVTIYAFFMAAYYSSVVDSQSALLQEVGRHQKTLEALTKSKEDLEFTNRALTQAKYLVDARNEQLEVARGELEHLAMHDFLTGLPNRRYLDAVLSKTAEKTSGERQYLALLHIDLDRFKQINDTLGHTAGDAVLMHVAKVLKQSLEPDDFIARIGGDEFVVLIQSIDFDENKIAATANRIISEIRTPIPYAGHMCRTGASIGISIKPTGGQHVKHMLIDSDIALYEAKTRGKSRFEFFSQEIQRRVIRTKFISDDILRGLENNEFTAYFQPKLDAKTRMIVGAEALARWIHPVHGVLGPDAFLQIAEELNAVAAIDRVVLHESVAQLQRWKQQGFGIPSVSVNVSMRRLSDPELIQSLDHLPIKPGELSFELLESIYLDQVDGVVSRNIEQLKARGVGIDIDDFGTGHASIASLLRLRPNQVKLDRQFVSAIEHKPEARRLVSSIIDIAESLNIGVVGEGVETPEQADVLTALGCDTLQGYAFSRPLSAAMFELFVQSYQPAPSSWQPESSPEGLGT